MIQRFKRQPQNKETQESSRNIMLTYLAGAPYIPAIFLGFRFWSPIKAVLVEPSMTWEVRGSGGLNCCSKYTI